MLYKLFYFIRTGCALQKLKKVRLFIIIFLAEEDLDLEERKSIFAIHFCDFKIIFMYAIVDIAGKQFRVTKDQFVYAPSMEGEDGASVEFGKVLLIGDGDSINVGTPAISGAKVTGKILGQVRGDKVIIFKKKRRKGYKKTQGHRQGFTKVLIEGISK